MQYSIFGKELNICQRLQTDIRKLVILNNFNHRTFDALCRVNLTKTASDTLITELDLLVAITYYRITEAGFHFYKY